MSDKKQDQKRTIQGIDQDDDTPLYRCAVPPPVQRREIHMMKTISDMENAKLSNHKVSIHQSMMSMREIESNSSSSSALHSLTFQSLPVVPPLPFPLEPHCCRCRGDVITILRILKSALREEGVEFEFSLEKYRFRCFQVVHYRQFDFIIRLLRSSTDGILLIEFQRRKGDFFAFEALYTIIIEKLASFAVESQDLQSHLQRNTFPETMMDFINRKHIHNDPLTLQALYCATKSNVFLDRQREATCTWAQWSEIKMNAHVLLQASNDHMMEHIVSKLLASCDKHVERAATSLMANVMSHVKTADQDTKEHVQSSSWLHTCVLSIIRMLEMRQDTNERDLELQREATRALLHMTFLCKAIILQQKGLEYVEMRQRCMDARLSEYSTSLLHALQNAERKS